MGDKHEAIITLQRIQENWRELIPRFHVTIERDSPEATPIAIGQLKTEPPPPLRPRIWQSDKQRKAWFATQGFMHEGGKPFAERAAPPKILEAWRNQGFPLPNGAVIALMNEIEWMPFVQGDWVQAGHLATGWVNLHDVTLQWFEESIDFAVNAWFDAAEPFRGV